MGGGGLQPLESALLLQFTVDSYSGCEALVQFAPLRPLVYDGCRGIERYHRAIDWLRHFGCHGAAVRLHQGYIVMSVNEFDEIIRKVQRLKALRRARAHVERLERELRGEPAQPDESAYVPEFLRSVDLQEPWHLLGESVFLTVT
jgi:hypothetical protein